MTDDLKHEGGIMNSKGDKVMKILWAVCVIPLLIGIFMIGYATKDKVEYPTDEYWVAKDYHHVYDKLTGEIADYISDNEDCYIDGDVIVVKTVKRGWYNVGALLTALFGMFTIGLVFSTIKESELFEKIMNVIREHFNI